MSDALHVPCPHCAYVIELGQCISNVSEEYLATGPHDGDCTVCPRCGMPLRFRVKRGYPIRARILEVDDLSHMPAENIIELCAIQRTVLRYIATERAVRN